MFREDYELNRGSGEIVQILGDSCNNAADLVQDLEAFAESKTGAIASIAERLTVSREIVQKTISDHAGAWAACRQRIKKSQHYNGLDLKPQLGLIPLGPDPDSELEEFLHSLTHEGEVPERNSAGKIVVTDDLGVVLVLIPGGTFLMGSQKEDPEKPNFDPVSVANERPVNEVELRAYFLSKYEMTQSQWQRAFGTNPSRYAAGFNNPAMKAPVNLKHPVERVSWLDCQTFLPRVVLLLPTEAEWERGARAGQDDQVYAGTSRIEDLKIFANINGSETKVAGWGNRQPGHKDDYVIHAPVGSFQANAFGLFDMTGNVLEWCQDGLFGYESKAGNRGFRGVSESYKFRVFRGGSFFDPASFARVANRSSISPESRLNTLGVRPSRIVTF